MLSDWRTRCPDTSAGGAKLCSAARILESTRDRWIRSAALLCAAKEAAIGHGSRMESRLTLSDVLILILADTNVEGRGGAYCNMSTEYIRGGCDKARLLRRCRPPTHLLVSAS